MRQRSSSPVLLGFRSVPFLVVTPRPENQVLSLQLLMYYVQTQNYVVAVSVDALSIL